MVVEGRKEDLGGLEDNLVQIDLGELVGDILPVGLSHLIADPPVGEELYHVEQVLLLPSFRL